MDTVIVEEHRMNKGNRPEFCCMAGAIQEGADYHSAFCIRLSAPIGSTIESQLNTVLMKKIDCASSPPLVTTYKAAMF